MALRKSAAREDPQKYVLKKDYKKACEIYREQLKHNPGDAATHLRLGDVLVLDKQTDAAISEYKRAAREFAESGFLLKAIGVNKKIVKLDPKQEDVHHELSKLYEERGLLAGGSAASVAPTPAPSSSKAEAEAPSFDMEESTGEELELGFDVGTADTLDPPALEFESDELNLDDLGSQDLSAGDMSTDELSSDDLSSDDLRSDDLSADDLSVDDLSVDDLGDALSDLPEDEPEQPDTVLEPDPAFESQAGDDGDAEGESYTKTPLFSDFTAAELVEVVKQMGQMSYEAGAVVVKEGDPGDALFVIVTGSVRVMTSMGGKEMTLGELGEGDFFGEGSLITGRPRTATIMTTEPSELLSLSKQSFDEISKTHSRVREVMLQFYEQRAESTVQTILGIEVAVASAGRVS